MIDREEEERLTTQFIQSNLEAALRACYRRIGFQRTEDLIEYVYTSMEDDIAD